MYSRYRIKEPTPPDYSGTAIIESDAPVEIEPTPPDEIVDENVENVENIEELPPKEPEMPEISEEDVKKNIFDELTLDDLLFMGALALLMSGKMGDEAMLLLSYILTCGI